MRPNLGLTAALAVLPAILLLGGCGSTEDKAAAPKSVEPTATPNPCTAIVKTRGDANTTYEASAQKLRDFSAAHPKSIRLSTGEYANSKTLTAELWDAKLVSGPRGDFDEFSKIQNQTLSDGRASLRIVIDNPDCFRPADVAVVRDTLDALARRGLSGEVRAGSSAMPTRGPAGAAV